jgi:copper homeostasis protein
MIIEIAVFNLESAIAAFKAGAHRIELCTAPAEGGLTPSAASIRLARKYVKIPIHVMIRPREGDFCYSEKEFESMLLDVAAAKIAGMEGVVAGILNPDGTVDEERMSILVEAAAPMNVTFHRAFDMTEGIENLVSLVKKAGNRISVMPGSGVNFKNIKQIAEITGANEMHLSARSFVPGKMKFKQPAVTMGGNVIVPDYDLQLPDEKMIQEIVKLFI